MNQQNNLKSILYKYNKKLRQNRYKRSRNELLLRQNELHFLMVRQTKIIERMSIYFLQILNPSIGRIWELPKANTEAWEFIWEYHTEKQFIQDFRMSKETFQYVCDLVENQLKPSHIEVARPSLSVKKQVAIAIYKLASYAEFRVVACVFGIGIATVHKCLYRFVRALNTHAKEFIHMPTNEEARRDSELFECICHIPQIVGCIDGSHIPILPPSDGYRDFINRKYWPSYVLQAVVGFNYNFLDISIKFPGSAHDAWVFRNSGLYKNIDELLVKEEKLIEDVSIPYFILGDPAYPLLPWMLKNYASPNRAEEINFNLHMNIARVRVENAFSRLKNRWHIIGKRLDADYKQAPAITLTACILHNILEERKESYQPIQVVEDLNDTNLFIQPRRAIDQNETEYGKIYRNALSKYLAKNFPLKTYTNF